MLEFTGDHSARRARRVSYVPPLSFQLLVLVSFVIHCRSLERHGYTGFVYLVGGFTYKADHHDALGATCGVDRSIERVVEWDYLQARTDTHELEERECGEVILHSLYKPTVSPLLDR